MHSYNRNQFLPGTCGTQKMVQQEFSGVEALEKERI